MNQVIHPTRLPSEARKSRRLLFIASDGRFFVSHRFPLAQTALQRGYEVAVACPDTDIQEIIQKNGFLYFEIFLRRNSRSPWNELRSLGSILKVVLKFRPNVVHLITAKPIIYGGIIARFLRVRSLSAITGLGHVFLHHSLGKRVLRKLIVMGYRLAVGHRLSTLIFQNDSDLGTFRAYGLLSSANHVMIRGSGTDLDRITPTPLPAGPTVVVLPARLLLDKGLAEFFEAARLLKARGVNAVFRLLGDRDKDNPTSVSLSTLQSWVDSGFLEWHPFQSDISAALANSHIVVLPSYREGFPKTLIDAAAAGRAAAASNVPGCRDAIVPGITGVLFEPRDASDMARVLEPLILDRALQARMGAAARAHAEANFDVRRVSDAHIRIYDDLTSHHRGA